MLSHVDRIMARTLTCMLVISLYFSHCSAQTSGKRTSSGLPTIRNLTISTRIDRRILGRRRPPLQWFLPRVRPVKQTYNVRLTDDNLPQLFNRPMSTKDESNVTFLATNFYASLFRKKSEFDWKQGLKFRCHTEGASTYCRWSVKSPYRYGRPTSRSSRKSRSSSKSDSSPNSDQDSCCSAVREWTVPEYLLGYKVLQIEDINMYQGYYGVTECRDVGCSGQCKTGYTAMSFLVMDESYTLEMRSFDVPTYCLCH